MQERDDANRLHPTLRERVHEQGDEATPFRQREGEERQLGPAEVSRTEGGGERLGGLAEVVADLSPPDPAGVDPSISPASAHSRSRTPSSQAAPHSRAVAMFEPIGTFLLRLTGR